MKNKKIESTATELSDSVNILNDEIIDFANTKKYSFVIDSANSQERLDKTLLSLVEGLDLPIFPSRSRLTSLIKHGQVLLNGAVNKTPAIKTNMGDVIEIILPEMRPATLKPSDIKLDIVFEDDCMLVINKQAGLTVHPGGGTEDDTLVNALLAHCGDSLSGIGGEQRPGIVHRLDKDTTGLMLVAKNDFAHQILSEQIQTRDVKRIYHTLVWNTPLLPVGTIETNIGRHPRDRKKMTVLKKTGKHAITHYKVLEVFENSVFSLVECQLETGRTHQIRVHFDHKKMPLVGDSTYGGNPNQKRHGSVAPIVAEALLNFPRQALHSKKIAFFHPETEELMEFEIDYPEDFAKLLEIARNN